ncbi:UDPglucose--hexose-1-phosphate uridylyltransferase [Actinocorallia herbida]|uniref:Galactose-1-phosphate uridylyltransferase n=1 Tax=Actinocorallia herbida TaxID=58109 RepID=A0A3N1D0D4_9ACTN|nr:UDPglucose--hexose-1-phosphate uridylyltransferase [Actinocorallia herbida]
MGGVEVRAEVGGRTVGRLADGRELVYYDDTAGFDRTAVDGRVLERAAAGAEVRRDPLTGEVVLVAAHRQTRTVSAGAADCPLCPSEAGRPSEIPAADYHVAVFENRFPALGGTAGGRCEVVSFSSDHGRSVAELPDERLATIGRAWAERTRALSALPGVEQVFVFENRGARVGATLAHPHGQIYAYPYLPPVHRAVLESARAFRDGHGGCLLCEIVAREAAGPRVVAETDGFVAYVPEAARWPYEVHLAPRTCAPDLAALDETARADLMRLYGEVLRRFAHLFGSGETPYMACWHQAPVRHRADLSHFYAQVFTTRRDVDKWKFLASSESGAGAFLNDVLPETAARRLRDASTDRSPRS